MGIIVEDAGSEGKFVGESIMTGIVDSVLQCVAVCCSVFYFVGDETVAKVS